MNDELQRMIEDRDQAESDAQIYMDEMSDIERSNPEGYEDDPDWESLNNAYNEADNWAQYLSSCIESFEFE